MQQRFSSSEEPTESSTQTEGTTMAQARMEAYLTRVCAPLFVSLPQEEATEQSQEMRSHLEALVNAHRELGATETEAVGLALAQFGKEQQITRAWSEECQAAATTSGRAAFWKMTRLAIFTMTLNGFLFPVLVQWMNYVLNGFMQTGRSVPSALVTTFQFLGFTELYALPALLGYRFGRHAQGKALFGSILMLPFVRLLCMCPLILIYHKLGMSGLVLDWPIPWTILLWPFLSDISCGAIGTGVALWRRRKQMRLAGSR